MSASATRETGAPTLVQSLQRFARAMGGADASGAPPPGAVEDALRAARWTSDPVQARVAAFRVLIRQCAAYGSAPLWAHTHASLAQPPGAAGNVRRGAPPRPPLSDSARAWRALAGLEATHRAALLLVAVERLPYGHAAAALDMQPADFVQALARAREALAARLAASGTGGRPHLKLVS